MLDLGILPVMVRGKKEGKRGEESNERKGRLRMSE